jgi:hypothetical protein
MCPSERDWRVERCTEMRIRLLEPACGDMRSSTQQHGASVHAGNAMPSSTHNPVVLWVTHDREVPGQQSLKLCTFIAAPALALESWHWSCWYWNLSPDLALALGSSARCRRGRAPGAGTCTYSMSFSVFALAPQCIPQELGVEANQATAAECLDASGRWLSEGIMSLVP